MARRARSERGRKKSPKKQKVRIHEAVPDGQTEVDKAVKKPQSQGVERSRKEEVHRTTFGEWWNANRTTVVILFGIFVLAFLMREYLYYQISFNTWPPNIVGNDPSYHKRVIDYVQENYHHVRIDNLLNYPLSSGNPRPPIFDWSIALMGIALSPLFGFNVDASTWFVFEFAPTFWGALTVIPMYLLGKEVFGKKAGLMAAFLLAVTASHIERSTLGFSDHDSFVVFFLVLSMYFMSKAFSVQKDRNFISDWRMPHKVVLGFRTYFKENKEAMIYSALTGLSIATIALTWQGYAYVMAILLIYYLIQLLLHRFRNEDALGTFMVIYIAMGMVVLLSLPYYYSFSIATWSQGFYIFLAMTMMGFFMVPTRDIPWLIVIPTLIVFLGASYAILKIGFSDTADLLFTGGGYFVSNKLYNTIAEAQAPEISRVVFTFGPGTFFLALVGVAMAFIKIPRNMRKDYIVIVVWTAVAIFMALSAVRFNFNATPAFALLAGWVVIETVKWLKAGGLSIFYSILAAIILLIGMGIVYEGWGGPIVGNYMLITLLGTLLISVGIFAYMKYRKNREWFKFRKVLTGMGIGFIVVMPNLFFAVDAAIPIEMKQDFDPDLSYLGSFGSSLHSEYWMDSYQWLAEQDIEENGHYLKPEERPGFMSWWDYGFDELLLGKHPTAADNFQNGYQFTGSLIASQNETEAISLMTARLLEGDFTRNGGDFSDEIWDILVSHLGDDRNSTWSAYEIRRIYRNSASYIDKVMDDPDTYGKFDDITWPNARYAAARVVFTRLGEEGVVDLYDDIIKATDKSLRYFAVDYRLFPFSASNTGIFYAPITLADRNVDDYLEYKVYAQENTRGSNDNPVWTDYPDNPISMEKAQEESKRLGYKFRINRYEMFYTDMFYNSLFYRTYVGWGPKDIGAPDDGKSVPAMFGDLQNYPAMQAWNMTHFKLVYRTMYYSELDSDNATFPDDYEPVSSKEAIERYKKNGGDVKSGLGQGVFYIKYYHGAVLSGRVRTEEGVGVPGVRVTVLDDFGIPHGNVLTGENGDYEIIAPPGEVTIVVSTGELANQYDKLYQFQVDQSTGQPMNAINITNIDISDDLAMRRIDDGRMTRDLVIQGKMITGKVYWDTNDDSTYSEGEDSLVTEGSLTFINTEQESIRFGPSEMDETGKYTVSGLVPGKYNVLYQHGSKSDILVSDLVVDPRDTDEKDIRIDRTEINGHVAYITGVPASNQTLYLIDEGGERTEIALDGNGNYSLKELFPGIYSLEFPGTRYYHEPVKFSIDQGETVSNNITLIPGNVLTIRARYPVLHSQGGVTGDVVKGAVVSVILRTNLSHRWTTMTDERGEARLFLPIGGYDISVYSIEKDQYFSYIGYHFLHQDTDELLTPVLEPAFRVTGYLTKLVDNPHNDTQVQFKRIGDGTMARTFSTPGGEYSIVLPKSDYLVILDNRSKSNVSYFHMQKIEPPKESNDLRLDIWTPKTVTVSGRVYWDKDGNGRFTDRSVLEKEGDIYPLEYGLENITVSFEYANGTIDAVTDRFGNFTVELPPDDFEMKVDVEGYDPFVRELTIEGTVADYNLGINGTDVMLQARDRALTLDVFYDFYGEKQIEKVALDNIEVLLTPTGIHRAGVEFTLSTDENGMIYTEAFPGEYLVQINREYTSGGISHLLSYEDVFFMEPGLDVHTEEIKVEHLVDVKGRMYLEENDLIRYPPEMTVNLLPIQGQRVTLETAQTDFNGEFEFNVPAGVYILEAHHDRPAAHYLYWSVVSFDDELSFKDYRMVQALPVDGDISPTFDGVKDSQIFFENGSLWTSAGMSDNGHFSLFLFPGDYRVVYYFQTEESSADGGYKVEYMYNGTVSITGGTFGLEIEPDKFLEIQGAVYHDMNGDRTIQQNERLPNANITFTPDIDKFGPLNITTDENGDYRAMVPNSRIEVTVDIEGYRSRPRDDLSEFDLREDPIAFRDIAVIPEDIVVQGIIFNDANRNEIRDEDEDSLPGMDLTFTEEGGERYFASTAEDGSFRVELPPGIYSVLGMKYSNGLPVYGYMNEMNIDMGDDLTDLQLNAVGAGRFRGTLFYRDTDGRVHYEIPKDEGVIDFYTEGRGTIQAQYSDSTYMVDLPFYDFQASSEFQTNEYDMEMTYRIDAQVHAGPDSDPSVFSLEFVKSKDYSFKIELVEDNQHEIEMGPSSEVKIMYYLENVGNEPYTVDVKSTEKPEGWIVELPEGEGIHLDIGEKVIRQLNISSPREPSFTNSFKFEGESSMGSRNTFQIQVNTPPSYRFDMSFDIPEILGVGYNERRVFNLTVSNLGSGEDVVNVRFSPGMDELEDWKLEWEGEPSFPDEGENVSLTPRGQRKFAITIYTPEREEDEQLFRESLTLTFTGKDRQGDVVTKDITFKVTKPNLVLPPGYLKLSNRRLEDPILNRTVEANITVKSLGRDASKVNVSLKIDGKVVAEGMIPYIPQDGTGYVKVRFNTTENNITENDFHTFEVLIDPYNTIRETDDYDNVGVWYNVVVGQTPEANIEINWRIVIFVILVLIITLGVIAYKQRTEPI